MSIGHSRGDLEYAIEYRISEERPDSCSQWSGRRYLQQTYLAKSSHPEFIKNSCKWMNKIQKWARDSTLGFNVRDYTIGLFYGNEVKCNDLESPPWILEAGHFQKMTLDARSWNILLVKFQAKGKSLKRTHDMANRILASDAWKVHPWLGLGWSWVCLAHVCGPKFIGFNQKSLRQCHGTKFLPRTFVLIWDSNVFHFERNL